MTLAPIILGLLMVLTVVDILTIVLTGNTNVLAIATQWLPIIALWVDYAYRHLPAFRIHVVRLLTYFGDRRTSMRVTARFGVRDEINSDDVVNVIRQRYGVLHPRSQINVHRTAASTIVELPGWQGRFEFSHAAPQEDPFDDDEESSEEDLLFTMPDTRNAIRSAVALLDMDILPLFELLTQELPLKLEAVEVAIRFVQHPNPYLAAYLQNVDLEKVTSLNCVVQESVSHAEAVISRDRVALRATTLNEIRNLTEKHLSLHWDIR
jgi:hypothetical protein